MLLIDRLPDTDVDIEALFEQELPCDIGKMLKENHKDPAPWCEEVAHWAVVIRCSECGSVKKALVCNGCRRLIIYCIRFAKVITFFSKIRKCGHLARKQSFTFVKI